MRYERTVEPTSLPVTVSEAKQHGYISTSDDDTYLEGLIAKATRYVEQVTSRQLMSATWVLRLDGFPEEIELRVLPVTAISSLAYTDADGVSQTLTATTDYQVDLESPDHPARIRPAYGCTWPSTRGETYNTVRVTFTAGYASAAAVPVTYKHAIQLLVQHWYENREPVNIGNIVNAIPLSFSVLLAAEGWGPYA
jgi:uncharacterized phiE125 gp8 family phage protein